MRSMLCALLMFAICAVAYAADITGVITKVDGDKITVTEKGKEPATFSIKGAKVEISGKDGKSKEIGVEGLTKILEKAKKGVRATITADGDKVSAVKITFGGKGKKDAKKDAK